MSKGRSVSSRKGCAGHVAGWAVFIARISRSALRCRQCSIDDLKNQNRQAPFPHPPEETPLRDSVSGATCSWEAPRGRCNRHWGLLSGKTPCKRGRGGTFRSNCGSVEELRRAENTFVIRDLHKLSCFLKAKSAHSADTRDMTQVSAG